MVPDVGTYVKGILTEIRTLSQRQPYIRYADLQLFVILDTVTKDRPGLAASKVDSCLSRGGREVQDEASFGRRVLRTEAKLSRFFEGFPTPC